MAAADVAPTPGPDTLSLVEVFVSAQGEGPEVGRTTVFVRLGGCDLRCGWCDSPGTWRPTPSARIERTPGQGDFETLPNPVSIPALIERVDGLAPTANAWVSLTGGEPLLQPDAVEALARGLAARGRRVYLETHGLHADALARCVDAIGLVSMDWKLASDVRPGPGIAWPEGEDFHDAHARFLEVATRAGDVYVKVVLTPSTTDAELDAMAERVAEVAARTGRSIPVVLQPVTPAGAVRERPTPERLLGWLARVEARLPDVRLIPQTHPIYGVL